MPKVSVIIPTCNRAKLVERAIKSVLDQTYRDFEILVSDDGSADDTSQVVVGFSDKRIRFRPYNNNNGVAVLRNHAVKNSNGKYIAFLDDDDEWLPSKLEKQIRLLEGSPDKLGAIYTGVTSLDDRPGRILEIKIPQHRGNILQDLLLNNFITTSSIIVKKHCFDEVGLFDTEYLSASDNDMWIRIAEKFEFDYVGEPLVNYYNTPISISRDNIKAIKGLERLMTKHYQLFSLNNRVFSNHRFKIGIAYCYSGNLKEGRKALISAGKFYPLDMRIYYNFIISLLGYSAFIKIKALKKSIIQYVHILLIGADTKS